MHQYPGILQTCAILCIFLLGLPTKTISQEKRSILTGQFTVEQLSEWVVEPSSWVPYPKYGSNWDKLVGKVKDPQIAEADKDLGKPILRISAALLLEFSQNGNRSRHGDIYFGRRNRLAQAVIAECMEREGRFMEDIIDLIWAICEETFWVIPAHYGGDAEAGLPKLEADYVDLFAAETGVLLAWTHYLLADQLDEVSTVLNKRILREIEQRILQPALRNTDYWWMGFDERRSLNNWTPWICSNWLACVLLVEKDPARRAQSIHKIMSCIDHFLDPYPADGGCDEGPGYWGRAGASLFDCLELLDLATKGKVDVWDHPLIKNIGTYIYKVHIKEDYYVNFADASAINTPDAALVYRYGKKIKDEPMMAFGSWLAARQQFQEGNIRGNLPRRLATFQVLPELVGTEGYAPIVPYSWLPDLGVVICRSNDKNGNGLFLAAKGGHNAESHNHNDIGNFILFNDGKPILIDIGVETYTKKTFSAQRYEIWTMQSQYHNLPTINGEMQSPGRSFKADDATFNQEKGKITFSLDIAQAYPESAGVKAWKRTIRFNEQKKEVLIKDDYELTKSTAPMVLNFMTAQEPTINKKARTISLIGGNKPLKMSYPKGFNATYEKINTDDAKLHRVWGDQVYRIQLIEQEAKRKNNLSFLITE